MTVQGANDSLFHSVLHASPDCIRLLDIDGCVEFMNQRGQALFEIEDFTPNLGRYWPDLWDEQNRDAAVAAVDAARTGEVYAFRSFCPTVKGTPKWWDTVVAPVFGPGGTEVVRLMATSRDITAEVEMRTFLDTIVQVMPEALLVKDARDGRFLLVNRQAEALLGISAQEMLGRRDEDFFPAEQAEEFRAADREVIESRELRVIDEEAVTTATGELRYLRTKKVGTYGDEGPRHLVVMSEDVTETRRTRLALEEALERAEEASRAKSDFLANMSHEVRTPLNAVIALAEMLSRTNLDAAQREMVRLLSDSGAGLTGLLTDVLDLVHLDAGEMEIEDTIYDLGDLLRTLGAGAEAKARAKGLRFVLDCAGAGPVRGDPRRLRRVLAHLLDNAVKFTEQGEVALSAVLTDSGWRFEVRDTGIGFDPSRAERLFERFEQADTAITRQFGGSGLGLSVTRGIVERLGGGIRCDSRPGGGSVFTVDLPLQPANADGLAFADGSADEERRLSVLLAEDNPTNRRIVELILSAVDADLECVENGALAVERVRERSFDVILMDMQMPVMDGLTATRLIRDHERSRNQRRTPVICVSANALPQHIESSRRADLDMHLAKPITAPCLLNAISSVLEETRAA